MPRKTKKETRRDTKRRQESGQSCISDLHTPRAKSQKISDSLQEIIDEALGRRNKTLNKIRRDAESSKGEKYTIISHAETYFKRNEKEVKDEYGVDSHFAFKELTEQPNKPLTYDDLKNELNQSSHERIGIVGAAGSGKTTLMERLERDLSQSKKLVVFLNFHHLGNKEQTTPRALFFDDLFSTDEQRRECYEWILENQENVIFLLDGLDQAEWSVKGKTKYVSSYGEGSTSEIISNILIGHLFPNIKVAYSSREHAVSNLEAFLNFATHLYEGDKQNPPTTFTEVMQGVVDRFVRSEHGRKELTEEENTGLQELAYMGLKDKKLTFKEKNFEDVGLDLNQIKDFVIIVPGHGDISHHLLDGDKVVIFLHQTFQEFFAGKHIVQMDIDNFTKTVQQDLHSGDYWSVVTRIVAGLLLNNKLRPENTDVNLNEKQVILKKMLQSKYDEGWAFGGIVASKLSILSSIVETEDSDFIQSSIKNISLHGYYIGTSGMPPIVSAMRECRRLDTLCLKNCGINAKLAQLLWESIKDSIVKIDHLDVSANVELGDGFQYICKLARHCNVRELHTQDCNLKGNQLSWLQEIKPSQLNHLRLCGPSYIATPNLSPATGDYEWQLAKNLRCQKNDVQESLTISDVSFESIGDIIADGGKLSLSYFLTTPSGLRKFQQTLDKKKMSLSKLFFRFTGLNADCCEIVGTIVKQCKIDELMLHRCKINSVAIGRLLETVKGAKITNLDLAGNKFDTECCELIANIVTQCSVDQLNLAVCEINSKGFEQFLITAEGKELKKLDVSSNCLLPSAITRLNKSIKVKNLVNPNQNKKKILTSSHSTGLNDIEKEINLILSQPLTKAKEIGPEGGVINLCGSTLSLPPGAHRTPRSAKISVRSSYEDAPEGYMVASSEMNCDTFGIPFEGFATICLQLHAIPDDGQVQIISKQDDNSDWEIIDVNPTLANKQVSFQVDHLSQFKAVFRHTQPFKIHLCHYIFFCASTSELHSLVCIDNDTLKKDCIDTLEVQGLKLWSELPDKDVLCRGEEVRYRYRCITPERSCFEPDAEVVTKSDIITYKQISFKLLPRPEQDINSIHIECVRTTSDGASTSVLALEWRKSEEQKPVQEVVNPVTGLRPVENLGSPQGQEGPGPLMGNVEITRSTREFYELNHSSDDVYLIDRNRAKGNVLIVNNDFRGSSSARHGSEVDVHNLEKLWKGLGFNVDIKRNLSAEQMRHAFNEFANTRDVSVVIQIVMSHGGKESNTGREFVTGEDGNKVFTDEIISPFTTNRCEHLCGIPKVFMFQACRGDRGDSDQRDAETEVQPEQFRDPQRADMLIVYPSECGYAAYRNPQNGSRLMEAVVKVFKDHSHDTHIVDLLTMVNREVAPVRGQECDIQGSNQVTHLRKKLFLFPGWP